MAFVSAMLLTCIVLASVSSALDSFRLLLLYGIAPLAASSSSPHRPPERTLTAGIAIGALSYACCSRRGSSIATGSSRTWRGSRSSRRLAASAPACWRRAPS
jgi:hypothetical protein